MILLTHEEIKSYEEQKVCHLCKGEFCYDENEEKEFKKYHKVRDHCHYTGNFRGAARTICNLSYKIPKKIPEVIDNGLTYDCHFIIKQLAEVFEGDFECLGENTEKYITFSVPIKKEHDNGKTTTYKLKFIDSFRFMSTSLSDLVDNLSRIAETDCIACKERKKNKSVSKLIGLKNNKLQYEFEECKKISLTPIAKHKLIKNFPIINKFSGGDIYISILLQRKGVYFYEDMDSWQKFNETSLPDKKAFYCKLNLKGISDKDYAYAQKVWKVFEIKNRGEYHDLYVQCDTLLLADVFENFRNQCIEIYEPDSAHFLSAPGLAWQACLKKTGVKLELLTDYDMLLMVEKGIRGGICQAIYRYAKASNKYMNNHNKRKIISYLMYLDANNSYGWAMSQKLPVDGFKCVKDLSQFNESFIKNYDENTDRGYFLEVDIEYPKILFISHKDLAYLDKRKKLGKI